MNEEIRKKVDDNWKSQMEKEKTEAQTKKEAYHQPTFTVFLSSISMQAMIAMGRIDNPVTGKKEESVEQARFLIDTLGILQEKTKGNLTAEEQTLLDDSLFNLRMMYVEDREKKK
ncbi:MAG: DUF1844 domain-containing protein [Candidatus Omnitrophota bacterium]|nr:MAG: DUF1844 domain-containing protein [Candidatus Omnitrophota bacterium]